MIILIIKSGNALLESKCAAFVRMAGLPAWGLRRPIPVTSRGVNLLEDPYRLHVMFAFTSQFRQLPSRPSRRCAQLQPPRLLLSEALKWQTYFAQSFPTVSQVGKLVQQLLHGTRLGVSRRGPQFQVSTLCWCLGLLRGHKRFTGL